MATRFSTDTRDWPVLVIGLHNLCNSEVYCWLSVFFRAVSQESRALPLVGAALQAYYDDGWTVTAMERMDHAIRTFRTDLQVLGRQRFPATICSGLLICSLCVSDHPKWEIISTLTDRPDPDSCTKADQ